MSAIADSIVRGCPVPTGIRWCRKTRPNPDQRLAATTSDALLSFGILTVERNLCRRDSVVDIKESELDGTWGVGDTTEALCSVTSSVKGSTLSEAADYKFS